MPPVGFEPGSLSERLLEFDTRSKPLGHHGRSQVYIKKKQNSFMCKLKISFEN